MRRWGKATGAPAYQLVAQHVAYLRKSVERLKHLAALPEMSGIELPVAATSRPGMVIGRERVPQPDLPGQVAAPSEPVNVPYWLTPKEDKGGGEGGEPSQSGRRHGRSSCHHRCLQYGRPCGSSW